MTSGSTVEAIAIKDISEIMDEVASYCIECGTLLPDKANFCPHCGKPAKEGETPRSQGKTAK
ncbi:MAG: zinc ribbon domain-containing protein, partial [Dehalococcoidia bacterium]|nr:zinc ribbon domain-containing protein [Dehalococcoidia bacterium]